MTFLALLRRLPSFRGDHAKLQSMCEERASAVRAQKVLSGESAHRHRGTPPKKLSLGQGGKGEK